MSLTVYLETPQDNGNWIGHEADQPATLWAKNITHNLGRMTAEVGKSLGIPFYKAIWRPEEIGVKYAIELVHLLALGLIELREFPSLYSEYNPKNGWGSYETLVEFVNDYLIACCAHPGALVVVSR